MALTFVSSKPPSPVRTEAFNNSMNNLAVEVSLTKEKAIQISKEFFQTFHAIHVIQDEYRSLLTKQSSFGSKNLFTIMKSYQEAVFSYSQNWEPIYSNISIYYRNLIGLLSILSEEEKSTVLKFLESLEKGDFDRFIEDVVVTLRSLDFFTESVSPCLNQDAKAKVFFLPTRSTWILALEYLQKEVTEEPLKDQGAFSTVYKIDSNKHSYIRKDFVKDTISEQREISLFKIERQAFFSLGFHKHIVECFGRSDSKKQLYFKRYLGDIVRLFNNKTIQDEEILRRIFFGAAKGIEYIHSRGFVHFDIKPGNILVDKVNEQYEGVICDLGFLQKPIPPENWHRLGTFTYMAPESLNRSLEQSYPVDIFAFGITMRAVFNVLNHDEDMKPIEERVEECRRLKLDCIPPKPCLGITNLERRKDFQDLLSHVLLLDPSKRYTVNQLIDSEYFQDLKETCS